MTADLAESSVDLAAYSPERPLLIFTDFPPDFEGGGAVILRSLLPGDGRRNLLWASPSPDTARAQGRVVQLTAGRLRWVGRRSLLLDATVSAPALAREVLAVAAAENARALWVVLHGAGVPVAAELVDQKALPIHLTVHDDPPFAVALRSRRYLVLAPWFEHCLARALAGAASVDVISEGMQRRYERRYGVRSFVVHRATPGPVVASPSLDSALGLRVGVLGNTYAYAQLPVLAEAVVNAARTLGVPGTLTFVGRGHAARLKRALKQPRELTIEETGHLPETEAIPVLREQFALYLNYPFGWRHAVLRQTSFPTKLSSYALAARPLLVHAPKDSSLAELGPKGQYVLSWQSMRPEEGADLLIDAWRDALMHQSVHEPAESVRLRYFEPGRNRRALVAALNALVRSGTRDGVLGTRAFVSP